MLEKEVKILEINVDKICKKLESLWAIMTFNWLIHDVYYDFPNWEDNKHKMHNNQRMFRVRKKWEVHFYTIKNRRWDLEEEEEGIVIKEELEREITDVFSFTEVLERYGMKKTREKKKHRISYSLDWTEFDIDTYDGIPALLEIEGSGNEIIQFFISKLWLKKHEQLFGGSKKLFKHYGVEYSNF